MPARAPSQGPEARDQLAALGATLRARRKALRIAAVTTAEAAGISRVTLHRIEKGEPSVTIGAVAAVATALGLLIEVHDPSLTTTATATTSLPEQIPIAAWPALRRIGWQLADDTVLSPRDAWALYDRNWRHVDTVALSPAERRLVQALAQRFGGSLRVDAADEEGDA